MAGIEVVMILSLYYLVSTTYCPVSTLAGFGVSTIWCPPPHIGWSQWAVWERWVATMPHCLLKHESAMPALPASTGQLKMPSSVTLGNLRWPVLYWATRLYSDFCSSLGTHAHLDRQHQVCQHGCLKWDLSLYFCKRLGTQITVYMFGDRYMTVTHLYPHILVMGKVSQHTL